MPRSQPTKEMPAQLRDHWQDGLKTAATAERCLHVKINGVRCGSPAMRGEPFCYFHQRIHNGPLEDGFPALEDANAIQIAIMQVLEALMANRLDIRKAGMLLYGLQTAAANIRRTNFEPLPYKVIQVHPLTELAEQRRACAAATKHEEAHAS